MLQATFLSLCLFSFSSSAYCQDKERETRTMEAVLSEIRPLRQDLRAAAVATRKAQIVIYRLHVQQGVVRRATERLETAKNSLSQLESQKKCQTEEIKRRWKPLAQKSRTSGKTVRVRSRAESRAGQMGEASGRAGRA